MSRHIRPTVAKWFQDISLGARLSLFVALIVFGVVTSVAYLEVRSFEGHIDRDLVDAARLGAQSAADTVAQRAPPLDPLDIRDTLHDLVEADPVLDAISVIEADEAGHCACSRARQRKNAQKSWTSRDEPSQQKHPPAIAAARW